MKKMIFVSIAVLAFSAKANAGSTDTIDFWHVYYNGVKIREYSQFGKNEIILKSDSIKAGDSITVKYFRDTPCSDCTTYLIVEDEDRHIIVTGKGYGTFNPVSFPLKYLVTCKNTNRKNIFTIFYVEQIQAVTQETPPIFVVRLE